MHGLTFGGHPAVCAIALKVIEIIEREDVLGNVRRNEPLMRAALESLRDIPIVGDIRGAGHFWAIELVKDQATKETFEGDEADWLLRQVLSEELHRRRAAVPPRRPRRPGPAAVAAARRRHGAVRRDRRHRPGRAAQRREAGRRRAARAVAGRCPRRGLSPREDKSVSGFRPERDSGTDGGYGRADIEPVGETMGVRRGIWAGSACLAVAVVAGCASNLDSTGPNPSNAPIAGAPTSTTPPTAAPPPPTTAPPATGTTAPPAIVFPGNADDYTALLVTAWQAGDVATMTELSGPHVATFLNGLKPPTTVDPYQDATDSGRTDVHLVGEQSQQGIDITVEYVDSGLGKAHAIVGIIDNNVEPDHHRLTPRAGGGRLRRRPTTPSLVVLGPPGCARPGRSCGSPRR